MKVKFQYPLFTASGDEVLIDVEADVTFGCDAETDRFGRPTECATADDVDISRLSIEECDWMPVKSIPEWILKEIQDMAFEKASEQIEDDDEEYFVWVAQAGQVGGSF